MVDINWGIMRPVDIGGAFQQGMERGQQQRDERITKNALAQVATNWPGQNGGIVADPRADEQNFNALIAPLAQINPMLAIQLRQKRGEEIERRAKYQGEQREGMDKAIGQAVLDVMQQPEDQRAARWDAYVDQFSQRYPNAGQYRGRFSNDLGMAVLAQSGLMQEYQKTQQPSYMAIPEGGTLVNTRDPGAIAQFGAPQGAPQAAPAAGPAPIAYQGPHLTAAQARSIGQGTNFLQWQKREGTPVLVTSPEEAASLPAGTIMVSPDGRQGVKR